MRLLMDADCLIKLTKAGLKELISNYDTIVIPEIVRKEVVDAGREKGLPDATVVDKNVAAKKIQVAKENPSSTTGDEALINIFQSGRYDVVATDDRKLVRMLKAAHTSFILPGTLLYSLRQRGLINRETALRSLDLLAEFISEDEYGTIKLLLEEKA